MAEQNKFRVVIAGGGTAGWVAAAALVRHLGARIDITLVESDAIGTVGVGESTIPTARSFHALLGIREPVFMRETNASFKLGISFEHWLREGVRYFHPFGTIGRSLPLADFQHFWLEARARGFGGDYGDYSLETQAALSNRFATGDPAPLGYAYHLDATAYAAFLRGLAEPAGVRRVEGQITRIDRDGESGNIAALLLESGERVAGDLFIDCTGFRALLIEGALETGYDDWRHWLPTDRAFAVQSETTEPPVPYTRAIAHGAGWRWRIPLQHRMGNGFVYASDYLDDDSAREQLLAAVPGRALFDPRLIRFTTGMRKKSWNRNCVALGLASGFIEPLESTSIHLVMIAVTRLLQNFPLRHDMTAAAQRFNAQARAEAEHIRDFIILHYKLNDRPEPFWRDHAARAIPDSLAARIALFEEGANAYQGSEDLFRVDSWNAVMLGQGVVPRAHHPMPGEIPTADLERALADLRAGIAAQFAKLPAHGAFLHQYCGREKVAA
ncbi:tryptophan halogenase family protein [Sphingomonas sp. HT-1]|uniref:tryptophan halogenase family protein n=1 Tax=unclassified Sphingomonas TaxID=196159 RepID=UPI000736EBE5|nr:tryptophan halogenase family protein [Sphingomonas sp. WG]KTF67976.1 tryptophan halogenase [Sphingomonas sp. WG]